MSTGKLKGRSPLKKVGLMEEFEKDRLKDSIDIVSLIQSYGTALHQKGTSWVGLCPFHDDKDPSFSVDRSKGVFHCFGCGAGGDAFSFVMAKEGVEFKEALSLLKTFSSGSSEKPLKTKEAPPEPSKSNLKGQDDGIPYEVFTSLEDIASYYHIQLTRSPEAAEYLKKRGLYIPDFLLRLKAGYCPGNLKEKLSKAQYEEMKQAGLFTGKGYETFRNCLVFPLLNEEGRTVGFYGRKLSDRGEVKHLYLKGPHRGLLNRGAPLVYREEIILTESVIDALSLLALGFQNVIPCYGTNGFTEEHLSLLQNERVKLVTVAFDNDRAGKEGAEKVAESLLKEGIPVRVIFPEGGKDWNEVLCTSSLKKEDVLDLMTKGQVRFPAGKSPDFKVTKTGGKYLFTLPDISYRLLGVKEQFINSLRVNVRAEKGDLNFIDNCDLYSARSRSSFSLHLSRLLDMESNRIEKDLVKIVEYLEEERDKSFSSEGEEVPELTEEEERLGLELLQDPDLFNRIESDMTSLGYVGESANKRLMYLAASSRKLKDPISTIVISQSSGGKSYLVDMTKALLPPEDVLSMTSLSDQALNYFPENGLLHKFLSIGEAVHSDVVDHQMREILSAQELSRLVTVKDEKTGQMVSRMVRNKAIVSAVMTSATGNINPENASRCFVINTDESEEQTRAIHRRQRQKYSLDKLIQKLEENPVIIARHQAAQRMLNQKMIINPFAQHLDFPAAQMRSRRDHERFMDLIASVCYLRQFQKEEKQEKGYTFIECDLEDYRVAYDIMIKILPSTLSNFPLSANLLYERIRERIRERAKKEGLAFHEVSITQREIRETEGFEHNFVKRNIRTLVEYEYLTMKGGQTRGSRARYSLAQDAPLSFHDLSQILTPEELEVKILGEEAETEKIIRFDKSGSKVGQVLDEA